MRVSSRSRSRSSATTSAGALRTKLSLASFACVFLRSACALARSLPRRSASAAASMSPAMGTSRASWPTSATAACGAVSPGGEQAQALEARQAFEQRAMTLRVGLLRGAGIAQQQRDAPPRADVHLAADLAHAEDHRLQPGGLALGGLIGRVVRRLRVGGEHHGGAADAGERRDALPDLLGDEGHERMQRALQRLEELGEGAQRPLARPRPPRCVGLQHRLRQLEVPVAEVVPGELVERAGGIVEAVVAVGRFHRRQHAAEARADPAVGDRELHGGSGRRRLLADAPWSRSAPRSTACCRNCGSRRPAPGRSGCRGSGRRARRR